MSLLKNIALRLGQKDSSFPDNPTHGDNVDRGSLLEYGFDEIQSAKLVALDSAIKVGKITSLEEAEEFTDHQFDSAMLRDTFFED